MMQFSMFQCVVFIVTFSSFSAEKIYGSENTINSWTYRAAVYEHRPHLSFNTSALVSWHAIEQNLNIYEDQIKTAAENEARIIVFPEDGIFGMNMKRNVIYEYLEIVDDPAEVYVNPCVDSIPTSRNRIQRRLSCAARWYQMYVVANFGTVVYCQGKSPCPPDGRFQYNTNVVFDSDGLIVARYHKQNLFFESQFDIPPKVKYAVFGSPLGNFGTFTCFDILFKEPVIKLIEEIGVVNIAFPTAWSNVIPEMFALGIHESFAIRMGVNLLSAEVHIPEIGMQGSGIYSSNDGALVYYNNNNFLSGGKLLISNVTTPPKGPTEGHVDMPTSSKGFVSKPNFTAIMESNQITFVLLDKEKNADELYLEHKNTKCYLNYTKENTSNADLYAFGIFDGLHISSLNSYIQVCALVKCANTSKYSCGQATRESQSIFKTLSLSGKFSTDYIFPSLLVNGANPRKRNWDFILDKPSQRGNINFSSLKEPIISSILYTRVYDKDNNIYTTTSPSKYNEYGKQHFDWKVESVGDISNFISTETSNNTHYYMLVFVATGVVVSIICSAALVYRLQSNSKSGYTKL